MGSDLAQEIVAAILNDLDDRGGFDGWWGSIDSETQEEIKRALKEVVDAKLESYGIL